MRHHIFLKALIFSMLGFCVLAKAKAQRFLSDYDSTYFLRDTLRSYLRRVENLYFSGYIQPQFQVAQSKGADTYSGGNFSDFSNNRFMLRRARIKIDYLLKKDSSQRTSAVFSFQVDVTERGVNVRDMFVR